MPQSGIYENDQSNRILHIYNRLIQGDVINKADEAKRFGVSNRSIQRDIEHLRNFFENQLVSGEGDRQLIYDKASNSYCLRAVDQRSLTNSEILAVCKILLESRPFCTEEMNGIIQKLLNACVPKRNQKLVQSLVANELYHYIEPRHQKAFVEDLWDIGIAVQEHRLMQITYQKQDGSIVERTVQPVGIMFSEFYFYLTAFINDINRQAEFENPDDVFPTIYRIDRIQSYEVLKEHFHVPYRDRFEEGEFRKRIQFMYGGRLQRIKFRYTGKNVDAVLDRLPTTKIIEQTEDGYILTAEVFGKGIDMWLRSQGDTVTLLNI